MMTSIVLSLFGTGALFLGAQEVEGFVKLQESTGIRQNSVQVADPTKPVTLEVQGVESIKKLTSDTMPSVHSLGCDVQEWAKLIDKVRRTEGQSKLKKSKGLRTYLDAACPENYYENSRLAARRMEILAMIHHYENACGVICVFFYIFTGLTLVALVVFVISLGSKLSGKKGLEQHLASPSPPASPASPA